MGVGRGEKTCSLSFPEKRKGARCYPTGRPPQLSTYTPTCAGVGVEKGKYGEGGVRVNKQGWSPRNI